MALQAFDPPTMLPQPLSIPVPPAPILEHAIGYQGDARFVAFYWSPYGDEAMTADGKRSGTCLGWYAFLAYIRHPVIARVLGRTLEESALGSSETDATHWLILDRETRQVGVMTVDAAEAFLRSQWPPAGPPLVMTMSEWQRLAADLVTHLEQQARTGAEQMLTEHNEAFEQFQAWLAELGQGG